MLVVSPNFIILFHCKIRYDCILKRNHKTVSTQGYKQFCQFNPIPLSKRKIRKNTKRFFNLMKLLI